MFWYLLFQSANFRFTGAFQEYWCGLEFAYFIDSEQKIYTYIAVSFENIYFIFIAKSMDSFGVDPTMSMRYPKITFICVFLLILSQFKVTMAAMSQISSDTIQFIDIRRLDHLKSIIAFTILTQNLQKCRNFHHNLQICLILILSQAHITNPDPVHKYQKFWFSPLQHNYTMLNLKPSVHIYDIAHSVVIFLHQNKGKNAPVYFVIGVDESLKDLISMYCECYYCQTLMRYMLVMIFDLFVRENQLHFESPW